MRNKIKKTWKFKFFGCSKCSRHEGSGLKHFDIIFSLLLIKHNIRNNFGRVGICGEIEK